MEYRNQHEKLELTVVAGPGPTLLGRDWLRKIRLDWSQLNNIHSIYSSTLQIILDKHKELFQDELGLVKEVKAEIYVDPTAQPRYYKPRPVPYALRAKVEQELERLEQLGIIKPVQFSGWAAPIVPIVKGDGSIRICGDYKVTVNHAAKVETYPLPKIDDLLASLGRGKLYTKLNLAHVY